MVGIRFDIEGGQTPAQINALLSPRRMRKACIEPAPPSPGHAGSIGRQLRRHNSVGDSVVKAIKAASLKNYSINLMVMDYNSRPVHLRGDQWQVQHGPSAIRRIEP